MLMCDSAQYREGSRSVFAQMSLFVSSESRGSESPRDSRHPATRAATAVSLRCPDTLPFSFFRAIRDDGLDRIVVAMARKRGRRKKKGWKFPLLQSPCLVGWTVRSAAPHFFVSLAIPEFSFVFTHPWRGP